MPHNLYFSSFSHSLILCLVFDVRLFPIFLSNCHVFVLATLSRTTICFASFAYLYCSFCFLSLRYLLARSLRSLLELLFLFGITSYSFPFFASFLNYYSTFLCSRLPSILIYHLASIRFAFPLRFARFVLVATLWLHFKYSHNPKYTNYTRLLCRYAFRSLSRFALSLVFVMLHFVPC